MSVRSDGTRLTQLTDSKPVLGEKHTQPSYSPDGKRIVYGLFAPSPTTFAVDMIKADGTNADFHRLTDVDQDPTFAPNRKRILFDEIFADPPQLATADLAGENVEDLTDNQDPDIEYFWPSYSPNGKKIVFVTDFGISVMNSDGSGITKLTDDGKSREPDWGPRPGG